MPVKEVNGYHVGQHGLIDVLNNAGNRRLRVRGEIISLIPTPHQAVYALIRTPMGTGVYRLW